MKKKLIFTSLLAILSCTFALTSCQSGNSSQNTSETNATDVLDSVPTEIDHYYSNKVRFSDLGISLKDNKFLQNGVAKLQLKSVTDGDTAVFYLNGEQDSYTNVLKNSYDYCTVRFLAIDTPESTSSIAPWGKKASAYVKSVLKAAEGIIVDASSIVKDIDVTAEDYNIYDTYTSGVRLDSNGTRWLALIWYCPDGEDPSDLTTYRSLQLDVIEECYSNYTGNLTGDQYVYTADASLEPKLYSRYDYGSLTMSDVLLEADIRSRTLNLRKIGYEDDPNYDYSSTPTSASIKDAYDNWDEWESNAKFVELTGVITRFIGNNFYFEDANGYPLYVYMGIEGKSIGKMFSVGDTIRIRGRLAVYGGQKQMTDIVWAKETFKDVSDTDSAVAMPESIQLTTNDLSTTTLDTYLGKLITITLNSRSIGRASKDNSYTLYSSNSIKGLENSNYDDISVRVNGTLAPGYDRSDMAEVWTSGNSFTVTGILGIYQEDDYTQEVSYPSYQIVVGNRTVNEDGTIESEIVQQ